MFVASFVFCEWTGKMCVVTSSQSQANEQKPKSNNKRNIKEYGECESERQQSQRSESKSHLYYYHMYLYIVNQITVRRKNKTRKKL